MAPNKTKTVKPSLAPPGKQRCKQTGAKAGPHPDTSNDTGRNSATRDPSLGSPCSTQTTRATQGAPQDAVTYPYLQKATGFDDPDIVMAVEEDGTVCYFLRRDLVMRLHKELAGAC
ncbi:hypothetical protein HPB48_025336 [Haemaphysalis longicornis]|uniref:Uncharacterized protein n=1 Tax=Haemaphysalis longicornis TaxID=44386 RepID=A0A9J6H7J8_HAELO|nr:hypothetical protein HPB48_025336 [Haemaphysalis longicornis]